MRRKIRRETDLDIDQEWYGQVEHFFSLLTRTLMCFFDLYLYLIQQMGEVFVNVAKDTQSDGVLCSESLSDVCLWNLCSLS
jgi:hypothetical protein